MPWVSGAVLTAAQLNQYIPQTWSAAWVGWTPSITAENAGSMSVTGTGRFIQFGKTIHWSLTVVISSVGTATNGLRFTLPVNALATGYIGNGRSTAGAAAQVSAISATQAQATRYDNATIIATGTITLSGTYESV